MTIIIVNDHSYVVGGAGKVAIDTAISLAKAGYNIILFTAVGPSDNRLENVQNLKVVCLGQQDILTDTNRFRAVLYGIWNFKAANEFRKLLFSLNPQETIIHIHSCSKALSTSLIKMAISHNFKILYHLHDYGISCPNLAFYNFTTQQICKLKPLSILCLLTDCDSRNYLHKIWRCIRQLIQTKLGGLPSCVNHFATVSQFSYDILKAYLPSNATVHLIRNPITQTKYLFDTPAKNEYFAFVGRLSKEKDPVILAQASKKLNVKVMFVGEGECRFDIQKANPDAYITGWVHPIEVSKYIGNTRVLVLPSKWYETQGMVVLEAAAKGIPSIVAKTSAAAEYIIDGVTGLTFESGNEVDLINKMEKLTDDDVVHNLGLAAYENFWSDPPSIGQYVKELESIYKKMIYEN